MDIQPHNDLRLALAASQFGGGQATMTRRVRREGSDAFDDLWISLRDDRRGALAQTADRLAAAGIEAILLGRARYPSLLAATRAAPAVLFVRGPWQLLHRPGLGLCGSRNATEEGLRAARACGEAVASHGFNVVSGHARGVDMAAHTAALEVGGTTVIVLPEGIEHFRIRKGSFADVWDDARVTVVSQFAPSQPWTAGAAMTRNSLISGLSRALVVVEAGEKGGTLAAGLHALERPQPVIALQLFGSPPGNEMLVKKGATVVRSRTELEERLHDLPENDGVQLSLM